MKELLQQVAEGNATVDEALLKMKMAPFEEIDIASLDHHRGIRQGASEVIYGAGKTPAQIDKIAHTLWNSGQKTILITRMSQEAAETFEKDIPFTYYEEAKSWPCGRDDSAEAEGLHSGSHRRNQRHSCRGRGGADRRDSGKPRGADLRCRCCRHSQAAGSCRKRS